MKTKGLLNVCTAAALFVGASSPALAEMSWTYADLRYQQPKDSDINGFLGEVSGHIAKNWVLQGRANYIKFDGGSDFEISQSRFDLAVGRLFALSNNVDVLISGGYTHLDVRAEVQGFKDNAADELGNFQIGVRGEFARKFEAELSLGVLFDEDDTSDLLWNLGVRYRLTESVSLQAGVNGNDENTGADEVMFELGVRFDLGEPERR